MAFDFSDMTDTCFSVFGSSVTYAQGDTSATVTAVREDKSGEYADAQGVVVWLNKVEYQIKKADLDDESITPDRGDTITDGSDSFAYIDHNLDPENLVYTVRVEQIDS